MKDPDSHQPQHYPIRGYWEYPNMGATNSSGFKAYAAGFRNPEGSFGGKYFKGIWWSSADSSAKKTYIRYCENIYEKIIRTTADKSEGISVRCIKGN